jgi:hypothetical protein
MLAMGRLPNGVAIFRAKSESFREEIAPCANRDRDGPSFARTALSASGIAGFQESLDRTVRRDNDLLD